MLVRAICTFETLARFEKLTTVTFATLQLFRCMCSIAWALVLPVALVLTFLQMNLYHMVESVVRRCFALLGNFKAVQFVCLSKLRAALDLEVVQILQPFVLRSVPAV